MKPSLVLICLLVLSAACSNENTANLQNSTATQVSSGRGNSQGVNAVNSQATQTQSGFGNQQSANLVNSSVTQTQEGIGNRQSIDLVDSKGVVMHQTGIGNRQRFETCGKTKLNRIQMNQSGILNDQTMRIGGVRCSEEKR